MLNSYEKLLLVVSLTGTGVFFTHGAVANVSGNGNYWSAGPSGTSTYARNLNFNSGNVNPQNENNRAYGFTVRSASELIRRGWLFFTKKINIILMIKSDEELLLDVFDAYYDARKHKRNTKSQLRFEMDLEHNLVQLYDEIRTRTYSPSRCMCFITEEPVKREVFASPFRDRVVHHLLFNYLSPLFERQFIYDSYSCRKTKGTLMAQHRYIHHIRSCSDNYKHTCYILKLDLKGYFMSIHKDCLRKLIMDNIYKKISQRYDEEHLWLDMLDINLIKFLVDVILLRDPTHNVLIVGTKDNWIGLPPSKSLFNSGYGIGLPIGDLTSQLFSNIYLNELDQYCKRDLKCRHYGRYVDDFYIIDRNANKLKKLIPIIRRFLKSRLQVTLHPKKISLTCADKGSAFIGGYIQPYRMMPEKRLIKKFNQQIKMTDRLFNENNEISNDLIIEQQNRINSYLGSIKHYDSFKLRKNSLNIRSLYKYFYYYSDFLKADLKSKLNNTKIWLPNME